MTGTMPLSVGEHGIEAGTSPEPLPTPAPTPNVRSNMECVLGVVIMGDCDANNETAALNC